MELLIVAGLTIVVAVSMAALFFSWQARQLLQQQIEGFRQSVSEQLFQVTSQVNLRLESVSHQVMQSQKSVGERLDNAARVVGEVQNSLGALGQASQRIFEIGKDIAGLQEILRSPKMRGGLGEYVLVDLLGQILPAEHFQAQYAFKTGHTVDAVIRLGGKMVPVDSKFPLENFRRMLDVSADEDRRPWRKKFFSDVKRHVDAIAGKYILPDEGTYDFALMFIPAENVYYECIIKEEKDDELALTDYCLKRRVIPVSPNSFYAYLQAILIGLKGFQIEENARLIMQNLARLQGDFGRFTEDFDVIGRHLSNAKGKYEDAGKRLERFQDKLLSIAEEKPSIVLEVTEPAGSAAEGPGKV
ncbi:MAG: DNA recombination protein RmuC [Elusimicrobia bacterium]|nr:DNA recombination protein RmuC [Elusimicrobiota bacterium]